MTEHRKEYEDVFDSVISDDSFIITEQEKKELVDEILLSEGVQKQTAVTSVLLDTRTQLDIKFIRDMLETALKQFDVKVLLQPVQKNTRYQILLFARKSHSL